jgi:virulence-associated protein VagC
MSRTTAKLFMHGRSQAVRLPKEFRMPGTEVEISREGDTVRLSPKSREMPSWDKIADQIAHIGPTPGFMEERDQEAGRETPAQFGEDN